MCPGVCAIKYCSSSTGTISVSTSYMLRGGGDALSRAGPPAGSPKINKSLGEGTFSKIGCMHQNFKALIEHENKFS